MSTIKKLTLTHFKNFHQVELELRPLNILIGKNGSGKSNFMHFFRLLMEGANEQFAETISQFGGIEWLLNKPTNAQALQWKIEFGGLQNVLPQKKDDSTFYEGTVAKQGNGFTISHEAISQPPFGGYYANYYYLLAEDGNPRILKEKTSQGENDTSADNQPVDPYSNRELMIAQIRDRARYPLLDEIRRSMAAWLIFRGFGENALQNVYNAQSVETVYPLTINPNGSNLVSLLHTLENGANYKAPRRELKESIQAAFPDFEAFAFPSPSSGKVELRWRTHTADYAPYAVSDGMIRFLGLATLLALPEPPSLIAIDEPEIGLHPSLLPLLAALLKQASERTQLIVTTHSPLLLDREVIEPSDVVLMDTDENTGEAYMQRADEIAYLDRWLERYTLGNLWTMGKLKGTR